MNDSLPKVPRAPLDEVRERPGGRSARIREDVLQAARSEVVTHGYAGFSYRAVAQRAGVDPATVYRRWPSRPRLVADALLELAGETVPVPDTGTVAGDFEAFLVGMLTALGDPEWLRLFRAFSAASAEVDTGAGDTIREFWDGRFRSAQVMISRAVLRGELPSSVESRVVLEQLVAPAYFRVLVSGQPIDPAFTRGCVRSALAAGRYA
ncbi:MAG: TetR/AcrR family transcriptional regulator [Pseudonocardia sp.]|jgi:AcrR family transcriptional regulator